MDEVKLNESPAKSKAHDQRAQDLRVIALQAAIVGPSGGMNTATVLQRAMEFERYLLGGSVHEDAIPQQLTRQWAVSGQE